MAFHPVQTTAKSTPTELVGGGRLRPLVLIVDPNETTRSVLEVALARDGFDVWSASSSEKGLELMSQGPAPDVIVAEADLGDGGGLSFVAQLRAAATTSKVPVLLLSRTPHRNLGALSEVVSVDAFIQKPAYARDVVALVRLEYLRRQAGGAEVVFQASSLPPAQLLRALLSCPRVGRLTLLGGRAEVWFRSGRVIKVRMGRGSDLETLIRALALTFEDYTLALEPVEAALEMNCGLKELVAVVMPRLATWQRVLQVSLPLDSRLVVDFARLAPALKSLPDGVNRVVQLFDGFRSLQDVLVDSPYNETLSLEVATRLYLMGVVGPERPRSAEGSGTAEGSRTAEKSEAGQEGQPDRLMMALFEGEVARAPVEPSPQPQGDDWFEEPTGAGLDVADPVGGWTAASASEVTQGLPADLERQLEAFQIRPQVEELQAMPDAEELRTFLRGEGDDLTGIDAAALSAIEAPLGDFSTTESPVPDAARDADHREATTAADLLAEALSRAWPALSSPTLEAPAPATDAPVPQASKADAPRAAEPTSLASPPGPSRERTTLSELPLIHEASGSRSGATSPPEGTPALPGMFAPPPLPRRASPEAEPRPLPRLVSPGLRPAVEALEVGFFESAGTEPEVEVEISREVAPAWVPAGKRRRLAPWLLVGLSVLLVGAVVEWLIVGGRRALDRSEGPSVVVAETIEAAPAPVAAPGAAAAIPVEAPVVEESPPVPVVARSEVLGALAPARRAYELGLYQKAGALIEQVLRDAPSSAAAWLLLGQVRYDSMDLAGARKAAERVLAIEPDNAPVQMLLASMYFDARDREAARAALQRYLRIDPSGPFAAEARALLKR
jgi:DNA-binding response OmpR family regulator